MNNRASNTVPAPRPGGPLIADNWKLLQSLYSESDRHLLPKPPYPPSVQAESNVSGGNLVINGCKYRISYCAIDPESQEVILEGEASDPSASVNVSSGRVYVTLPVRVDNKIINGYRIYRLTSFRTVLYPSAKYTVSSSTDDCVNSTYSTSGTATIFPIVQELANRYVTSSGYVYGYFNGPTHGFPTAGTAKQPSPGGHIGTTDYISLAGTIIVLRGAMQFNLDALQSGGLGSMTVNSVTFTATNAGPASTYPINILAYDNDPTQSIRNDDFTVTTDGTFFSNINLASGLRKYASSSTAFEPVGTAAVTIGASSTSQACVDVALCKTSGKAFNLAFTSTNEATASGSASDHTSFSNPKLSVSYSTAALGFTLSDNRLLMGDRSDCGIRFQNVQIPANAVIQSASITFTAWPDTLNNTSGTIVDVYGQAGNASTFSTQGDFTGRTKTTNFVTWSAGTQKWSGDSQYTTPDLSQVVQEIVNGTWAAGNNMAFIIQNDKSVRNSMRVAYSFNGSALKAPVLNVVYTTANAVGTMYRLVDTIPCEGSRLYIDNIADSVLNNNIDLIENSSTDLELANFQSARVPTNPFNGELVRTSISTKSTFTVPDGKILFITHLSGYGGSFTLGSVNPSFNIWGNDNTGATSIKIQYGGYLLLPTPLPVGAGTTLTLTSGSGTVYILGYYVSNSMFDVVWKTLTVGGSTVSVTRGAYFGCYTESTFNPTILRDGNNYSLPYYKRFGIPNTSLTDGEYATGIAQPVALKEGDALGGTGSGSDKASIVYIQFN